MTFQFKLPDVGEGIHEGEIVKWLVKEGETVQEDQPLVEVMTDKATVEITSPKSGKIAKLNAKEGDTVNVGDVIVEIDTDGGAPKAEAKTAKPAAQKAAETGKEDAPAREKEDKTLFDLPSDVAVQYAPKASRRQDTQQAKREGPVLAAPATRRLAREKGLDLATIQGTGPAGRIERADVERAAEKGAPVRREERAAPRAAETTMEITPTSIPKGERERRIPVRGLRKRIAEKMAESKRHAAHFAYVEEVDVTELVAIRNEMKPLAEERGVKLTYLPFFVKAAVHALKKYPVVNGSFDEAAGEIVEKHYYNIGIAVDTPNGLSVPIVKDADERSLLEVGREIERVAEDARNGKSKLEDVQGGTFTITSLGKEGGFFAIPVINYPELAIMGIHNITKRPVVAEDGKTIVIRDIMNVSFSFDHRIVDGSVGAKFAQAIVEILEKPKLLMLEGA